MRARNSALLLAGCLASLTACAAPTSETPAEGQPLKAIEPVVRAEVEPLSDGLVRRVRYTLVVEAPGDLPLTLVGAGAAGSDDALLELRVRTVDYAGTVPVSQGRSVQRIVPFGADGVAAAGEPFRRPYELDVEGAQNGLARRVHVSARLFLVDVRDEQGRTGAMVLNVPTASAATLARPSPGSVYEFLHGEDPGALFLSAAATSPAEMEDAVGQLIDSLSYTSDEMREAVFAALLYLTGETHGRSEYRWKAWWRSRQEQR